MSAFDDVIAKAVDEAKAEVARIAKSGVQMVDGKEVGPAPVRDEQIAKVAAAVANDWSSDLQAAAAAEITKALSTK